MEAYAFPSRCKWNIILDMDLYYFLSPLPHHGSCEDLTLYSLVFFFFLNERLLENSCFTMLVAFLLLGKFTSAIHITPPFWISASHLGHHSALVEFLSCKASVLISYFLYIYEIAHVNPNLSPSTRLFSMSKSLVLLCK